MSAPALLSILSELDAELRATADAISGKHPADNEDAQDETEEVPRPVVRGRGAVLAEHEH